MTSVTILKSNFTKQGGAEKYARQLADAFHKRGCIVRVLTTEPVEGSFPYEVVSFAPKSKTSVSKLWDFECFCDEFVKKHPTDIVFGNDRNRFQTHLRAGSGSHKAFLEHRKLYEPKWKRFRHMLNPLHTSLLHIEKTGFEHPDLKCLFVNSHMVKDEILSQFVIDPSKITVIHNGVEWESFASDFTATSPNGPHFEFLFVGSGFARKGLLPLLKGLALLPKDTYHLTVIGLDKHQKAFERAARGLNVTFVGPVANIRPYMQRANSLVIPSFYDPFANVTVEALAMGLFVVSSKTNGGHEVLTPSTGCVIENLRDPQAMKAALETAMHRKHDRQAIRDSVKRLDFSTQLNTYLDTCLAT
jgi:UDP-glucose:(heptosyl)LPS alpha-1,3-glucosyltransferase